MPEFPLQIPTKVNNPELEQFLSQFPAETKLSAEEINLIVDAINFLETNLPEGVLFEAEKDWETENYSVAQASIALKGKSNIRVTGSSINQINGFSIDTNFNFYTGREIIILNASQNDITFIHNSNTASVKFLSASSQNTILKRGYSLRVSYMSGNFQQVVTSLDNSEVLATLLTNLGNETGDIAPTDSILRAFGKTKTSLAALLQSLQTAQNTADTAVSNAASAQSTANAAASSAASAQNTANAAMNNAGAAQTAANVANRRLYERNTPTPALTGTSAESLMDSFMIPAGTYSLSGLFSFLLHALKPNGSLSTTTLRVRIGSTPTFSLSLQLIATYGANSRFMPFWRDSFRISDGLLVGFNESTSAAGDVQVTNATLLSVSVTVTAPIYVFFTAQHLNSADSMIISMIKCER